MILIFKLKNIDQSTGALYKTDLTNFEIEKKSYGVSFSVQEKKSSGKIHTRIVKVVRLGDDPSLDVTKKNFGITEYKKIYEKLMMNLFKIESQYRIEINKRETEDATVFNMPNDDIKIDLSKEISMIPEKLTPEDIKSIVKIQDAQGEIIRISLLNRLKNFSEKWSGLISKNALEINFQNMFDEYPEILPIIFPRIHNIKEIEYKITSSNEKNNKIDILADGKEPTIIELKRPSTNLFSSIDRNNMSGLSKELITAAVQLSLYNKRVQIAAKKLLSSFTHGILIIGNSANIDTEDKETSWKLFKENFSHDIYTFDEILLFVDNIISNIK
ncbi:MAG: DUF4263 domain-containing protein [Mollicutes bacterium PWAP]|nr:DUF4263 domain-containing protein [Mollicutes bacterium PWAP]